MHKRRFKGFDYGACNHPDLEPQVESVPEPVEEIPSMEPDYGEGPGEEAPAEAQDEEVDEATGDEEEAPLDVVDVVDEPD